MWLLVACEESQTVCKAFRAKGHNAFSCDILDCSGGHPEWHIKGDCVPLLDGNCTFTTCDGVVHTIPHRWDMIIAHPPCTYLSKAGARWMYPNGVLSEERYKLAQAAREFFFTIQLADCKRIVIENPVPLKVVNLPIPDQIIQPYLFDCFGTHPYSKKTCLWILGGLSPLVPTTPKGVPLGTWCPSNTSLYSKGHGGGCGLAASAKLRSKTFDGIAAAMADQWGF